MTCLPSRARSVPSVVSDVLARPAAGQFRRQELVRLPVAGLAQQVGLAGETAAGAQLEQPPARLPG